MRATRHSGRMGYARHNDRDFDTEHAPHIDKMRSPQNFLWHCYPDQNLTFEQAELQFYQDNFAEYMEFRNQQLADEGHSNRSITASKLVKGKKTMPEEVIYQIGNKDESVDAYRLWAAYTAFTKWHESKFGQHVYLLDAALHMDEESPHIHERRVWVYTDSAGRQRIGQHKALEQMGYALPDPSKPRSRSNNLKIPYTAECREKWLSICQQLGISVETVPENRPKNEQNLRKEDYIILKQQKTVEKLNRAAEAAETRKIEAEKATNEAIQQLGGIQQQIQEGKETLELLQQNLKDEINKAQFSPASQDLVSKMKNGTLYAMYADGECVKVGSNEYGGIDLKLLDDEKTGLCQFGTFSSELEIRVPKSLFEELVTHLQPDYIPSQKLSKLINHFSEIAKGIKRVLNPHVRKV